MNDLFSLVTYFINFPPWLRNTIYILTTLSMVGIGVAFSPSIALLAAIGLLFVIAVLGIYGYVIKQRQEKRQAAMGADLKQNTAAAPRSVVDPSRRARLDDLRKKFQEGLEKFHAVGKSVYKLPWYVVVGEPGGGKTEAIRRCEVGFPPGLQDYHQGSGGTINMNWWFTDHAVLLDTAGRIIFEEVAAGSGSEWKEFLRLLRKNRPNCPINGLLLVIPADTLVKDSPKDIEKRAGWIARQLDGIQRELDIRFPVYVVISKCDLLNGFREFFAEADAPDLQRQMLGWSNPNPLDTAFQPDLVDQYLYAVVERLRERRLPLLEDPVARGPAKRRTDEVDRLYALSNSVSMIAPNLSRYLSTIFVAGEWSAKPLFLRGIYFTSSLREGVELDQELAQAVGLPIEDLPAEGIFRRDITYFLRDLFLEKIFREWGLVTRATNTKRMLLQRQVALFSFGFATLALLLLCSWFGYDAMKASIGRQSGYWFRASEGWQNDTWMPIVSGDPVAGYHYNGDAEVGAGTRTETRNLFSDGAKSLVQFHAALCGLAQSPLNISPVFRPFSPLEGNFDAERREAQRVVLEGSVIKPLIDQTRAKIVTEPETSDPVPVAQALLELVRVESGILKRTAKRGEIESPRDIAGTLQGYLVNRDLDQTLANTLDWTYQQGDGAGKWPEGRLSGGDTLASEKPAYNQALDVGIEHFRRCAMHSFSSADEQWRTIEEIVAILSDKYGPAERNLFQSVSAQPTVLQLDPLLLKPHQDFEEEVAELDKKIAQAKEEGLFSDGSISLYAAYEFVLKGRNSQATILKTWIDKLLQETLYGETQVAQPSSLLNEVQARLNTIEKETQSAPEGLDPEILKRLDGEYLADYEKQGPLYKVRASLYALSLGAAQTQGAFHDLIGKQWAPVEEVVQSVDKAAKEVAEYQGSHKEEAAVLCAYWLDYAKTHQIVDCCNTYLAEARAALSQYAHFPVTWPPEADDLKSKDEVIKAADLVRKIKQDLRSETYGQIPEEPRRPLEDLKQKAIAPLSHILDALVSPAPDNKIVGFTMSMAADASRNDVEDVPVARAIPVDPNAPTVAVSETPRAPEFELRNSTFNLSELYTAQRGNLGRQGRIPVGIGHTLLPTAAPVDTIFHFHYYDYSHAEPKIEDTTAGDDWCALRLLATSPDAGIQQWDTADWQAVVADKHPPVTLNLHFDRPLPPRAQWPTRESLNLGE